jgi:Holliday junction DNA helicase RuvA
MIDFIHGKIVQKKPTHLIVNVGGIGYKVHISTNTEFESDEVFIHTHIQYTEDNQKMFGFKTDYERSVFLDLISVQGIGPNTALIILSSVTNSELIRYICTGDKISLGKIKGIGPKTAERMILELKDKKLFVGDSTPETETRITAAGEEDAIIALQSLGYTKAESTKRVQTVINNGARGSSEITKQALRL